MSCIRPLFALSLFLFSPSSQAAPGDIVVAQAEAKWCYRCHGDTGIAENARIPNLAGQHAAYIAAQLRSFQQEREETVNDDGSVRAHRSMAFNAKRLSEENIKEIARYYEGMTCGTMQRRFGAPPARPEAAARCEECHGPRGLGTDPTIPKIGGQNEVYLLNQLTNFQTTSKGIDTTKLRDWRRHPDMGKVTAGLDKVDLKALAAYFSSLPCR